MSPRKSGHWASLQQAMAPVQNQEENIEAQPVQATVEEQVVQTETTIVSESTNSGSFMDDDFEIPANAFSLFDDEEKASDVVDGSQDTTEELLIGETEEPPAKESEYKWNAVEITPEVSDSNPVDDKKSLDDDFEIPADAFSLFEDEDEAKPAPKRPAKEKKSDKSDKPVSEKTAKKDKSGAKAGSTASDKFDKADKTRKLRKEKKDKNADTLNVEEATPKAAPEHVCEAIVTSELDDSVVHSAETQMPVFYPVHQTEVAPVALPEETVATESTPAQWSATSLLDDLIPDSEIDRVNQKNVKSNPDKKTSKKFAKAESKAESKPAKTSKKPIVEDDDDIPFDIPVNAFALPDYKVKLDKKSESKPVSDKKREKCVKAEPVQEVSKPNPLEEDDFDIPTDAFSMFDDAEEKKSKPVAKSRSVKPVRESKPVREQREECEERFEKEVREPRSGRRREPVYEDESDEYPEREERRPERVAKPVRRPAEMETEGDVQPVRKSREVREVREGEPRRPAINIPSWRDVMDVLIDMNLNRRRETERPSRTARGPRNSEAFKPENYDDYEEKMERQNRNSAPRRRQRRPE